MVGKFVPLDKALSTSAMTVQGARRRLRETARYGVLVMSKEGEPTPEEVLRDAIEALRTRAAATTEMTVRLECHASILVLVRSLAKRMEDV